MSGRTCLLVTHATQLTLPFADYVVCLANGSVEFAGTRQAYFERIGELARSDIYEFSGDSDLAGQEELSQSAALPLASKGERANGHLSTKVPQLKSANLENMEQGEQSFSDYGSICSSLRPPAGSVSFHIYRFYLQAFTSKTLLIAILVVISLTEVAAVYTNWLLRLWTNALTVAVAAKRNDLSAYNEDGLKANHYLKAYIASACISLILYGARLCLSFTVGHVCMLK